MKSVINQIRQDRPILIYVVFLILILFQVVGNSKYQPKNIDPQTLSIILIMVITALVQIVVFKYKVPAPLFVLGFTLSVIFMAILAFVIDVDGIKIDLQLWIVLNFMSCLLSIPLFYYIIDTIEKVQGKHTTE